MSCHVDIPAWKPRTTLDMNGKFHSCLVGVCISTAAMRLAGGTQSDQRHQRQRIININLMCCVSSVKKQATFTSDLRENARGSWYEHLIAHLGHTHLPRTMFRGQKNELREQLVIICCVKSHRRANPMSNTKADGCCTETDCRPPEVRRIIAVAAEIQQW